MKLRPKETTLLDPIEIASRDEIAGLQLSRLKWALRHAYDNVGHYRRAFERLGVHPDDLRTLDDLRKFPFTTKETCATITLSICSRCRATRWCASTPRPAPPANDRGRLHPERHRCLVRRDGAIVRAAGGRPGMLSTLRSAMACSPAASARITAPSGWAARWCRCRRPDRRQVQLILDFRTSIVMVTPSYMLTIAMSSSAGTRPAAHVAARRPARRRAVDKRDAARDRGPLRMAASTCTGCPKSSARASPANASKPDGLHIWEIILSRDRRPRPASRSRWRAGRAGG